MSRLAVGMAVLALFVFAPPAFGWADDYIYGITNTEPPHLVAFESNAPGTLTSNEVVSGKPAGERVVGMDLSPRDGELYVLTEDTTSHVGKLYVLDAVGAGMTLIGQLAADPADTTGPAYGGTLPDTDFGVDFIPQSNLL